ncbi:MAG: hypothetical protein ABWY90_08745, partial [Solirubrobacterales bacterium]
MQLAQSVERVPGQLSGDEASGHDPHAVTLGPMDLELLERRLADRGMPAYRADQVWEWTARGAGSYDEMTNLPAALRTELADLEEQSAALTTRWQNERDKIAAEGKIKEALDAARLELEQAQRAGDLARAGELSYGKIPEL